jgi:AraC-like DNA-binding protein
MSLREAPLSLDSRDRAVEYDTDALPSRERIAYWQQVVADHFVPLAPVPTVRAAVFAGRIVAHDLGGAVLSSVTSRAQRVVRGPAELGRGGDAIFVNVQLRGVGVARQGGRVACLEPGTIVVLDSRHPFALSYENDFEQLSLALPGAQARRWLPNLLAVSGRSLSGLAARLLADHMIAVREHGDALDSALAQLMGEQACQLLAHAAASSAPVRRLPLLVRARSVIDCRYAEADLGPSAVAAALHVSIRTLQKAFTDAGLTFRACLLERRLHAVYQDLEDAGLDHLTIAAIGARNGLPDPCHLARAYRVTYHTSPSARRRKMREPTDEPR